MRDLQIEKNAGTSGLSRRQLLSLRKIPAFSTTSRAVSDDWMTISRKAMACDFRVIVNSRDRHSVSAATECLDEVDRLESILSIFRPMSEASQVNRDAAISPIQAGPELAELLRLCNRIHDESKGAFDITTGSLSECWGFQNRSPSLPAPGVLASARKHVGHELICLSLDDRVSFAHPGVRINFGGVGKGYALDRGASSMATRGIDLALLSAGYSSVLAVGAGPDGDGWHVGLRHPFNNGRRMANVRLRSCAMATSGHEEQWFEDSGMRYGHIMDPHTGFPATKVLSVSVITDSAAHADALATAFFVGGPDLAEQYCSAHEGTVAVMLLHNSSRPVIFGNCNRTTIEVANG
jgi:FAD:protein FMN transferase